MASTPVILLVKRTGNASDRPNTATVQAGEVALSFGGADPGLYFKDSAAAIRKVGPPHYGSTAPNSSPVGSAGNSVGELWVTSSSPYYMQVWNGSSWQKVGAAFADSANIASVTIASGALVANSTPIASGSLGCIFGIFRVSSFFWFPWSNSFLWCYYCNRSSLRRYLHGSSCWNFC